MDKFQHKHVSEQAARVQAAKDYANVDVIIIKSRGAFYLENADGMTFLRNFEREVYSGKGGKA